MEMRQVGTTGLEVSVFGLGTMTSGRDTSIHTARDLLTTYLTFHSLSQFVNLGS